MNNAEEQLEFVRRYATVLRPGFVYDTVVAAGEAMARGRDAAQAEDAPYEQEPPSPAPRKLRDVEVLPVPIPNQRPLSSLERAERAADETMEFYAHCADGLRPVPVLRASDAQQQSDLEFYTQCAAEDTRLA
jgi:hypothetical protein